jgi:hypothetical protein
VRAKLADLAEALSTMMSRAEAAAVRNCPDETRQRYAYLLGWLGEELRHLSDDAAALAYVAPE